MEKEDDGAPPAAAADEVEGEYEDEEMIDYGDDDDDDEFPYPILPPTPPLPSSSFPNSPDIKMDDVHQHEESQVHPIPAQHLVTSDINENQQDSDDDGPPPGWESKRQPEPELQTACPTPRQSDIKTEDVPEAAKNDEDQPQSQGHPSPAPELDLSDTQVEQHDSEDDGPPPGWDPRWQSEPKTQPSRPKTPESDMKTETNDGQQDAQNGDGLPPDSNAHYSQVPEIVSSATKKTEILVDPQDSEDEGPPPGWDYKCQPESMLQVAHPTIPQTDSKMEDVQEDTQNKDNSQPQPHTYVSPAPELLSSDIKVEEKYSEGSGSQLVGPSEYHPKPEPACSTTPPSDSKMKDDQQDTHGDDGPPPGWESTPQQQSKISSNPPSPLVPSGIGCDQKNVNIIEESSQPPPSQGSIPPTKPQILVPKPPSTIDHHEMGQMVCGSCRRLLSYPRGARYVECACCLEENYVLEEHEVGQLICGGCNVLLMYPYGAPKVRCANCSGETEIGDQNRRLPLSEHKRRARQHLKRVQAI
uniref:pollen-specific leucine-rich repeat extensin-like protein 1 isoform X2 n=1 Tax=Erigeron canadensis TaxID=72917 RepID=UPI001CB91BC9|nr:pollen-specific leucine-rich repeat extensin-like protein 1 isoform X2 [Erigeron canadensis]